jgi:nucleotide-binding universal stress UspA family protein
MLHRAPSSVLVARPSSLPGLFPSSVVVGYDGSAGADASLAAARNVAARFGARVRVISAGRPATLKTDAAGDLPIERDARDPVEAVLTAWQAADLVVIGSRGLHGLHALGSVSERVGHRAAFSVLVM